MRTAVVMAAAAVLLARVPALPQDAKQEARAKLEEGKAAAAAKNKDKALEALKAAIELDPDLTEAHDQLSRASGSEERAKLYEEWEAKFPSHAIFAARLADASMYSDYKRSETYARKAIQIDPKCAPAYMTLALIAEAGGDMAQHQAWLKKAAEAQPDDPSWFFYYSNSLQYTDPEKYHMLALEVAKRFPNHERGAQSLYWLAFNSTDKADMIRYGEMLKNSYPPGKFSWSESGMSDLFELYAESEPAKALALAKEVTAAKPTDKSWPQLESYADALVTSHSLVAKSEAAKAVALLTDMKPPRLQNPSPFYIAKAAAEDAAGNPAAAYQTLLGQMGQLPTDSLKAALVAEGAKTGKSAVQVSGDLWALLEKNAKPAPELATTIFAGGKKLALADYQGKVVLLNFWYPFCGPCRGEFPYLQAILTKYAAKGFTIVSPNVHPPEDDLVLPYMKGMHFGFIPVHSDADYAEKQYGARGFPANFLIDQQGRIVYKPRVIRGVRAQRTLELQIETVLEHAN